jgi:hypothetical protein
LNIQKKMHLYGSIGSPRKPVSPVCFLIWFGSSACQRNWQNIKDYLKRQWNNNKPMDTQIVYQPVPEWNRPTDAIKARLAWWYVSSSGFLFPTLPNGVELRVQDEYRYTTHVIKQRALLAITSQWI